MIVFDLRCAGGHVFEAWFQSGASFDDQRDRDLIACPICADVRIEKAPMAPNIPAKANRQETVPVTDPKGQAEQVRAAFRAIAAAQANAIGRSTWVGENFAQTARSMHDGETERAMIHGQATADDARALIEDGVEVMPLLIPVIPPERRN